MFGQRKHTQLDTCCKAPRIGNVVRFANSPAVQFRQAIYEIMLFTLDTVIHRKINNLHVFRDRMRFHEFPGIAMRRTEEKAIDFIQRKLGRKAHIRLPIQTFVDIRNPVARIAGAIDKDDFHVRMIDQQANQFACRITSSAYNSYFNHIFSSLWFV